MLNERGDGRPAGLRRRDRCGPDWRHAAGYAERPESTCVFIYTSGTTGFPKGVMHASEASCWPARASSSACTCSPSDRLLCILPMFHVNAICYSLGGTLAAGATLVLEPRFSASRFWQSGSRLAGDRGEHDRRGDEHPDAPAAHRVRARPRACASSTARRSPRRSTACSTTNSSVPTLIEGYGMSRSARRAEQSVSRARTASAAWASRAAIPIHAMAFARNEGRRRRRAARSRTARSASSSCARRS